MNLCKAHIYLLLDHILEETLDRGDIPMDARRRLHEELVHMGLLEVRPYRPPLLRPGKVPPAKLTLAGHAVLDLVLTAANTGSEWREKAYQEMAELKAENERLQAESLHQHLHNTNLSIAKDMARMVSEKENAALKAQVARLTKELATAQAALEAARAHQAPRDDFRQRGLVCVVTTDAGELTFRTNAEMGYLLADLVNMTNRMAKDVKNGNHFFVAIGSKDLVDLPEELEKILQKARKP